jgi:hypothetical protein
MGERADIGVRLVDLDRDFARKAVHRLSKRARLDDRLLDERDRGFQACESRIIPNPMPQPRHCTHLLELLAAVKVSPAPHGTTMVTGLFGFHG